MLAYPCSKRGPVLCRGCILSGLFKLLILIFFLLFCLWVWVQRLDALWRSQVGQHSPSPLALCVCALSAFFFFFGSQNWEISYSVQLKSSHVADKSCAEGVPSPRSSMCFLRLGLHLSTWDIFFSHYFSSFSISAPSLPIFLSLLNYKNYIIIFFIFPNTSHFLPMRLSWTNALSNPAFI